MEQSILARSDWKFECNMTELLVGSSEVPQRLLGIVMYSWRLTRKDGVCCIHGLSLFSDSPQIAKMGTHPHSFGGSVQIGRRNYFGFNLVLGYSIKFHLIYDFLFVCLFAFSTLAVSIVSFICFFWYLIIVKKYRGACTWVMHASACMLMGYACKCMHAHGLCEAKFKLKNRQGVFFLSSQNF